MSETKDTPSLDSVSIIIATFGEDKWEDLAYSRALPSAKQQKAADEIVMVHEKGGTAATCKNTAIEKARGPWIVICDADDELEPGYVAAMKCSAGDLRYPKVRIIKPRHPVGTPYPEPIVIDQCSAHLRDRDLLRGNFMVIGTMFRKEDFLKVGGFQEFETWEDWFFFMQLTYIGAVPCLAPGAVYRVFQHEQSRVTVSDPSRVFLEMKDSFRKWAVNYNGGETNNIAYRKFIEGRP